MDGIEVKCRNHYFRVNLENPLKVGVVSLSADDHNREGVTVPALQLRMFSQ
jgi:hypothetical protein